MSSLCGRWIWEEKFVTTTENVCGNQRVLLFCPMFWVAGYCGSGCFWLFITRLYSSDLRLGWQNRILMTARAQCHRRIALDSTHYNQAIPGHYPLSSSSGGRHKTIGNNSLVKLTFVKPRPQTPKPQTQKPKTKGPWAVTKISWPAFMVDKFSAGRTKCRSPMLKRTV